MPQYQLDSYLLLDYKAVGVELIVPLIEVEKGKKLQGLISEDSSRHLRNGSKYLHRSSQTNKNYAFSPRYDCQQSPFVATVYTGFASALRDKSINTTGGGGGGT